MARPEVDMEPQILPIALRSACVGAVLTGLPWLGGAVAIALSASATVSPASALVLMGVAASAPLLAAMGAHLVAGPDAVRFPPNEWLLALSIHGPLTWGAVAMGTFGALAIGGPGGAALGAALGALAGLAFGTLASLPFVMSWAHPYRSRTAALRGQIALSVALVSAHTLLMTGLSGGLP